MPTRSINVLTRFTRTFLMFECLHCTFRDDPHTITRAWNNMATAPSQHFEAECTSRPASSSTHISREQHNTQAGLTLQFLRFLDRPLLYRASHRRVEHDTVAMRKLHTLAASLAVGIALVKAAPTQVCEPSGRCIGRCQQKLAYCMAEAGLDNAKILDCQAGIVSCEARDCGCIGASALPIRTHNM